MRSGGSHCPFGQDEMYGRGHRRHNGLIHERCRCDPSKVIPEVPADVDGLWIHSVAGGTRDGSTAGADRRVPGRWATPLGDFNHRWLAALFRPIRPIKDLFNGTWLGHPVHAAITDVPIGTLLIAVVLDVLGYGAAADVAARGDRAVHARGRGHGRRRLRRYGWHRPGTGHAPLDADGRRRSCWSSSRSRSARPASGGSAIPIALSFVGAS